MRGPCVANAAAHEGDPGTPGSMVFTLSRHGGADQAMRVYYQTVDGSAVAGTH